MLESMITLSEMDKVMFDAQRNGLISFYLTGHGEEAVQIGSAAALNSKDLIWGQYRESGDIRRLIHCKIGCQSGWQNHNF